MTLQRRPTLMFPLESSGIIEPQMFSWVEWPTVLPFEGRCFLLDKLASFPYGKQLSSRCLSVCGIHIPLVSSIRISRQFEYNEAWDVGTKLILQMKKTNFTLLLHREKPTEWFLLFKRVTCSAMVYGPKYMNLWHALYWQGKDWTFYTLLQVWHTELNT